MGTIPTPEFSVPSHRLMETDCQSQSALFFRRDLSRQDLFPQTGIYGGNFISRIIEADMKLSTTFIKIGLQY